jgi:prophage DNA circulation protein
VKYVLEYKIRTAGLSHDQNFGNQEALINAFGKWKPGEGLTVHAFVGNLAGDGGYVLVEAAEPGVVQSFVSKFTYRNDIEVVPVVAVAEAVTAATESLAWARAASSS